MLVITLSSVSVIIFVVIVLAIWFGVNIKMKFEEKGTMVFRLNVEKRRIKRLNSNTTGIKNHIIFTQSKIDEWVPLDAIKLSFKGTSGEKLFRHALIDMSNGKEFVDYTFVTNKVFNGDNEIWFRFIFIKIANSEEYNMDITWKQFIPKRQISSLSRSSTFPELIENNKNYLLFVSFLIGDSDEQQLSFIDMYSSRGKSKTHIAVISHHDIVTFVYASNSNIHLIRKSKKIKKYFEKFGTRTGLSYYNKGSSMVYSKGLNSDSSAKKINRIIQFLIYQSAKTKSKFVDSLTFDLKADGGFEKFNDATKNFNVAMRSLDISRNTYQIRKMSLGQNKTNTRAYAKKKIIDIVYGVPNGVDQLQLKHIVQSTTSTEELRDRAATKFCLEKKADEPFMIDINSKWLVENHASFKKNRNIIYIINFNCHKSRELLKLLKELSANGIQFGLRVKIINEQFSTLVKLIKPKFIIIAEEITEAISSKIYIELVSLKNFSDRNDFKIIYKNPNIQLGNDVFKSIGAEFFYSTKNNDK